MTSISRKVTLLIDGAKVSAPMTIPRPQSHQTTQRSNVTSPTGRSPMKTVSGSPLFCVRPLTTSASSNERTKQSFTRTRELFTTSMPSAL